MNIPIYRAKKIDSDEWVEGYYVLSPMGNDVIHTNIEYSPINGEPLGGATSVVTKIDPNTLAIHFQNMIDKNGKKIFASLSENGVGGDDVIYKLYEGKKAISVARYRENQFHYCQNTVEVIGIHKG